VKVFEQPQHFTFHIFISISALKCCLKKLLPDAVQTKLVTKKPSKLRGREVDALGFEICHQRPEPGAELTNALSRTSLQI